MCVDVNVVVWLEWCGIRMQASVCIRIPHHSSQTTSGASQPLLIPLAIVEESQILHDSDSGLLVPDAADTVICAPEDRWRNHPKHVE